MPTPDFEGLNDHAKTRVCLALLLVLFTAYVALTLTPSHYAVALRELGIEVEPLFGQGRAIRMDEWGVLTPLFQTTVYGGFQTTNQVSPYEEPLKGFFALPILDWSLAFKPQLWGFFVVPPAYAYSLYFGLFWLTFLVAYTVFLIQLGARFHFAAIGAVALYFNPFVQAWWTTNAPTFALAPLPMIVLLSRLAPVWKLPLLFYATSVWVFGLLYPPFIMSAAFAFIVLIIAFRRDVLTLTTIAVGLAAVAMSGAAVLLYFGELVEVMSNTIYPGQRQVQPGTFDLRKLLAHIFPYVTTRNFESLIPAYNNCEIAVISTLLPLNMICFTQYRSLGTTLRREPMELSVVLAGLVLMLLWLVTDAPEIMGKVLFWSFIPPDRMAWGFGLLFTLALSVYASRINFKATWFRAAIFVGLLVLSVWLVKYPIALDVESPIEHLGIVEFAGREIMASLIVLATVLLVSRRSFAQETRNVVILFPVAYSAIMANFAFNPLQAAHPIFEDLESPRITELRANAAANPNGWAVVPDKNFRAILSGIGIPAINHTLMTPQLNYFRKIFPDLSEDHFNSIFNRYSHIMPWNEPFPDADGNVMVLVPRTIFESPLRD